jgi:hypothetical protein
MTLIATTLNYKMPFLISDLLGSDETDKPISLPTVGDRYVQYLSKDEADKPVRLVQKMYISRKICILFAGEGYEIIPFLLFVRDYFENIEVTLEYIHACLKAYELHNNYPESAFVMLYFKDISPTQKIVNRFYWPGIEHTVDKEKFDYMEGAWNVIKEPLFEEVAACGTGAREFLDLVRVPVKFDSNFVEGDFRRALQANTGLIVKLMAKERTDLKSILSHWGGGFELAFYNGDTFEKIGDIAYVVFHGKFDAQGDIGTPIPMSIMYYRYVGEILYITALEVHHYIIEEMDTFLTFTSTAGKFHTRIFEVEPLDMEDINAFPFPEDFSFETNRISIGYSLLKEHLATDGQTAEKQVDFYPSAYNEGWEISVTFKQRESLEVKLEKNLPGMVAEMCKERFPFL